MTLPWKQLVAMMLILAVSAAATGPPPDAATNALRARSQSWLAHQPTVAPVRDEAEERMLAAWRFPHTTAAWVFVFTNGPSLGRLANFSIDSAWRLRTIPTTGITESAKLPIIVARLGHCE